MFINSHSLQWNSTVCLISRNRGSPIAACSKSGESRIIKRSWFQNMDTTDNLSPFIVTLLTLTPCKLWLGFYYWNLPVICQQQPPGHYPMIFLSDLTFLASLNLLIKNMPFELLSLSLFLLVLVFLFFNSLHCWQVKSYHPDMFPFPLITFHFMIIIIHLKLKRHSPRICLTIVCSSLFTFYLCVVSSL